MTERNKSILAFILIFFAISLASVFIVLKAETPLGSLPESTELEKIPPGEPILNNAPTENNINTQIDTELSINENIDTTIEQIDLVLEGLAPESDIESFEDLED